MKYIKNGIPPTLKNRFILTIHERRTCPGADAEERNGTGMLRGVCRD